MATTFNHDFIQDHPGPIAKISPGLLLIRETTEDLTICRREGSGLSCVAAPGAR